MEKKVHVKAFVNKPMINAILRDLYPKTPKEKFSNLLEIMGLLDENQIYTFKVNGGGIPLTQNEKDKRQKVFEMCDIEGTTKARPSEFQKFIKENVPDNNQKAQTEIEKATILQKYFRAGGDMNKLTKLEKNIVRSHWRMFTENFNSLPDSL